MHLFVNLDMSCTICIFLLFLLKRILPTYPYWKIILPTIDSLHLTVSGVAHLLRDLEVHKAYDPDGTCPHLAT